MKNIRGIGIQQMKKNSSEIERHKENVRLKGYTLIRSVLSEDECHSLRTKSESIYQKQVEEFGLENLRLTQEENTVRYPLYYDESFLKLICQPIILDLVSNLLKNKFILHTQNAIIVRPHEEHHQTGWHRDIPYQDYTTSQPIAINVFYCLSPFNEKTGSTKILPGSHLFSYFPSAEYAESNGIHIEANPGDVLIFDSWLFHRAGHNTSDMVRYGINHVYTLPIIKQQIDLPAFLGGKYSDDPLLEIILGYTFQVPKSVIEYRKNKLAKIKQIDAP